MKLFFGTALDNRSYPYSTSLNQGSLIAGPTKLLTYLEQICLSPYHETTEAYVHIRLELVRKFLQSFLDKYDNSFFGDSFSADPYGTSKRLLELRDELLLASYDFVETDEHKRLELFNHLEIFIKELDGDWPKAFADRFDFVRNKIQTVRIPLQEIHLAEPLDLLPQHFKKLIEQILDYNPHIRLVEVNDSGKASNAESDLGVIQDLFIHNKKNLSISGDGSFQIWEFPTESDASQYISQILNTRNSLLYIPDQSNALDRGLSNHGYPSMGLPSSAPVRPGLMLLKSISVFLWGPLDLFKVIDFLKLPASPFDKGLARELINKFFEAPGFDKEEFEKSIKQYFEKKENYSANSVQKLTEEYDFWFNRTRYDVNKGCPKAEVLEIYKHLSKHLSSNDIENQHRNLLYKLCVQLIDLLESFEAEFINQLQLEHIVNSIFQAAPFQLDDRMKDAPDYVTKATSILQPSKQIIWWNCVQQGEQYQFSTWSSRELAFLNERNCYPDPPALETKQKIWRRLWPLLQTQEQLILVVPKKIKGEQKEASNIITDLEERLSNLHLAKFNVTKEFQADGFEKVALKHVKPIHKNLNNGFTNLDQIHKLLEKFAEEKEWSYSSLNKLFYHPYQFAFSYLLKLRRSSVESIKNENRIKGIVGHYVFEKLFQVEQIMELEEEEFTKEFNAIFDLALSKKGAIFLLYGKESERQSLKQTLFEASKVFKTKIKSNGWSILLDSCERREKGKVLNDLPFMGIMDMVLYRGAEVLILDLKWYQSASKTSELSSKEDLQLILYALLEKGLSGKSVHTAYFLFKTGQFISRNEEALKDITVVTNKDNSLANEDEIRKEVESKMLASFKWRTEQLMNGEIEMYLNSTKEQIDAHYKALSLNLLPMLELKTPFEKYDNYKNLIGLYE
jgi:ATP-dependent helicase/nuclease subunit B